MKGNKNIKYIFLGALIGISIYGTAVKTSLSSEFDLDYKIEVEDFKQLEEEKNHQNVFDGYEEIKLRPLVGYHIRDSHLRDFMATKVVIYGKMDPLFYVADASVSAQTNEEEPSVEENGAIGEKGGSYSPKHYDGFSDAFDMNKREAIVIETEFIRDMLMEGASLPIDREHFNVSSSFGPRQDPFLNVTAFHTGLDLASFTINNSPVYSVLPGVVSVVGVHDSYGNYVVVNHGEVATLYAHLSSFEDGLIEGMEVNAGDQIGRIGSTGRSTGPHLHFEFDLNGVKIDPEPLLGLLL